MKQEDSTYIRLKYGLPTKFEYGLYYQYMSTCWNSLPDDFIESYFDNAATTKINGHHYDSQEFMDELVTALVLYEQRRNADACKVEVS